MIIFLQGYISYLIIVSLGISFGYHRYFSHNQFKISKVGEIIFLSCGIICGGRSPLSWVGVHRMHHAYSDTDKDPQNVGTVSLLFSLWRVKSIPKKFIADLLKNPRVMFFHKYRLYLWVGSFLVFIPIIHIWIIIQIFSYFGFGMINYFGHREGKPTNCWWLNFIAPFEGNHKSHHQNATSCKDIFTFR